MSDTADGAGGTTAEGPRAPASLRGWLARDLRALVAAAAATAAVELGVYLLALWAGGPGDTPVMATLAASCLWTALAAPVLAASGKDILSALLRAGVVADAGGLTLLVLWLVSPQVTFLAAARIYCVLVCMVLPGVAAWTLGRSASSRYAASLVVAAAGLLALTSPFWAGGAMKAFSAQAAPDVAAVCVCVNPFYSVAAALPETVRFVWHQATALYRITRLGDFAMPPAARWYTAALVDLASAAALLAAGWLIGLLRGLSRPRAAAP